MCRMPRLSERATTALWTYARRMLAVTTLAAPFVAGCATEPDTIRLLDVSDAGSGRSSCRDDTQCAADRPRCEPNEHQCVECLSATECPMGMSCSSTTHSCQDRCASGADCAGLDRRVCNGDGACVQCASDDDCAASTATPHCDQLSGTCVECLVPTDCDPRPCFDDCLTCVSNKCVWRT